MYTGHTKNASLQRIINLALRSINKAWEQKVPRDKNEEIDTRQKPGSWAD